MRQKYMIGKHLRKRIQRLLLTLCVLKEKEISQNYISKLVQIVGNK